MAFEWRNPSASGFIGLTRGEEFASSQEQHYRGWLKTEMATSIGEKLRLARETRGIALRDISEQTRISMRYLEAIEADDYRRLPGGIFNRSFIRAYAKHIGYDEQEALEDYATMMHERGESTDEVSNRQPRSLVYTDNGGQRSPLLTVLLAIIILAVLSLGAWAAWYFYEHRIRQKTQAPSHASQRLAVERNLMTIQNAIAFAQPRVMERRNTKEDANEPVA
jgi:cytoskeletal protein RodZ